VDATPQLAAARFPFLRHHLPAIEIRPRRATELVDASFQLLRRYYSQLVTVSAITMAPGVLLRIIMRDEMSNPQKMGTNPGPFIVVALVTVLSATVSDAVLSVAASDGYLTGDIDLSHALSTGMGKIVSVFLASFFRGLLLTITIFAVALVFGLASLLKTPLVMIPVVPFAIWAMAWILLRTFALTSVVVLEDTGPNVAMARSMKLTKGCTAHIFFSLGLAFFLYFIITAIISVLGITLLTPTTAEIIGSLVIIPIYPLLSVVSTMLYYDLRIRKEGFDLEIMSRELGTDATPLPAA